MAARDITVGSIMDAGRWLVDAVRVARHNPPGSAARRAKLDQLAVVTSRARQVADASNGKVMQVVLRAVELGIDHARLPSQPSKDGGRHARASQSQTTRAAAGAATEAQASNAKG